MKTRTNFFESKLPEKGFAAAVRFSMVALLILGMVGGVMGLSVILALYTRMGGGRRAAR